MESSIKKIRCPKCNKNYGFYSSKIPDGGFLYVCKKCKRKFLVTQNIRDNLRVDYGHLRDWLKRDGLEYYMKIFEQNDIRDKRMLLTLTENDLLTMGITSIGHRKKIFSLISRLEDMFEFVKNMPIGYLAASIIAFIYVSGYLIHSTLLRTLGISSIPFFRNVFLETGATYTFITIVITLSPIAIVQTFKQVLKKFPDTNFEIFLRTLTSVVCIFTVVFLAVFLTDNDWLNILFVINNFNLSTGRIVSIYIFSIFILIFLSVSSKHFFIKINRLIVEYQLLSIKDNNKYILLFADMTSLFFIVLCLCFNAAIIYMAFIEFDWIWHVLYSMSNYILTILILYYTIKRTRKRWKEHYRKFFRLNLITVCSLFAIAIVYISILSYSNQVYIYIPTNRGGMLPTTQSVFIFKDSGSEKFESPIKEKRADGLVSFPMFVIEEDDKIVYASQSFEPTTFLKAPPKVYGFPKSEIKMIEIYDCDPPRRKH